MPRRIVLTGRELSVEETARLFGVSRKRTREIVALMDDIMAKRDRAKKARRKKRDTRPDPPVRRASRTRAATRRF